MGARIRVLACQIEVPAMAGLGQRDAHLSRVAEKIDRALAEAPADLVVLPELSSIAYGRETFDRLGLFAEALDGPSFEAFSPIAKAHGVAIAYGMPRIGKDAYHISQAVVGPDGALVGHYDKLHMAHYGASMEKDYFQPGDHLLTFQVKGLRIAPIICYDIRFPELARTLCLEHRVGLVLHCGAYFRDESFYSWHHFVVACALENQVYVLSLNRAGDDFGGSLVCPPWVDRDRPETRFGAAEIFERIKIDAEEIDAARRAYTFLADRLDDYAGLPKGG